MTAPSSPAAAFEVVRTSGRSMRPLIHDGSTVIYRRASPEQVSPGDIIVFWRDGRLTAHRLLRVRQTAAGLELREKGDANRRGAWISASALAGRVLRVRGANGRRPLDVEPGGSRRLRLLVRLMRAEDDAVEWHVAATAGRPALRVFRKCLLVPAAMLAAPLRWGAVRALLSIYRDDGEGEGNAVCEFVASVFRGIFAGPAAAHIPPAGLDPLAALDAAADHGLLAPAAQRLAAAAALPAGAAEAARRAGMRAAIGHAGALAALEAAGGALAAGSVPFAVLKGPYLQESLYRDRFPRAYEDIDILVPASRRDEALAALGAAGYEEDAGAAARFVLRLGHFHLALRSPNPAWPAVELHWSMVDRANLYRLPRDEFFGRLATCDSGRIPFTVLALEDELIYLCLHASKHGVLNGMGLRADVSPGWFCGQFAGNRLLWFADIGLLLAQEGGRLDWRVLQERLDRWNVREEVVECLRVLDRLAPESPAAAALARLGTARDSPAAGPWTRALARFVAGGRGRRILERAMKASPTLVVRPVRLLGVWRLMFPPPERLRSYYAEDRVRFLPWLYLLHPFRMLRRLVADR